MAHSCLAELWRVIELKCTELLGNSYSIPVEVADRWASGLDSWCLSGGVKFKLCSHPDTPRTKLVAEAELCRSNEIRCPPLRSRKTLSAHGQEGFLRVKKGGPNSIIGVDMHPHATVVESILAENCTPLLRRVQGPVSCENRNM